MNQPRPVFFDSFLLRWTLANMLGCAIGAYAGVWTLRSPAICLNGGLAAACIGLAQWLVLRRAYRVPGTWILVTTIGGAFGVLPALFTVITLVAGGPGMFASLTGLLFFLALSAMQRRLLPGHDQAGWWMVANGLGGAAGGWFSVVTIIGGLPLGLLIGSALYGLITGWTLTRRLPPP